MQSFEYNKNEYEIKDAINLGPYELDNKTVYIG